MPPASMRHDRQIAPIQKSRVRSIDAAHTAETCTIPDERHRGGLLQQSEKRAGCSSSLPLRGRDGTCLIAVESSIVNKPTLLDWLRTAAQHYANWLRRTRLTVPRGDPAKRRPNLP